MARSERRPPDRRSSTPDASPRAGSTTGDPTPLDGIEALQALFGTRDDLVGAITGELDDSRAAAARNARVRRSLIERFLRATRST